MTLDVGDDQPDELRGGYAAAIIAGRWSVMMTKNVDALIEQNIRFARSAMLNDARQRLKMTLDTGQRDDEYASHHAVYAAARAFCAVYERASAQEERES